MILVAVFAEPLGLDRSGGWGPARTFLLGCGSLLALAPHIFSMVRRMRTRFIETIPSSWFLRWQELEYLSRVSRKFEDLVGSQQILDSSKRKKKTDLYLILTFSLTILVFTWIISVGRWVEWPDTTNYFHLQAQAFLSGQLHLLVPPSEQILQLSDPYKFDNRVGIPYLWDASLYNGNYHLYWGPIPAVITAILESVLQVEVGDQYLVYIFTLGAMAFSLLVLKLIWNRFFSTLAAWTILPWAIMLCFGNPGPWLMGRPAVYEAAIASGQFFFAGGLYWFLLGFGQSRRSIQYNGLSGAFFIGAIASRITLLPGVLMLGVLGVTQLVSDDSNHGKIRKLFIRRYSIYYGLIMLGLLFIGWFNHARFGNVFEFGHRYQLTSWGMANSYEDFFSWRNVLPNFYNYFLTGYRSLSVFPFVKPGWGVAGVPVLRAYAVAIIIQSR
ncbi:MAG: hypothetical protein E4G99_05915 [Anaerolineales bacterium]|nr:MAG: hypothetical protein E4G99_05915 [Anaerolineales bacterium]